MIVGGVVSERRKFVRVAADLPVQLRPMPEKNPGRIYNSMAQDMSESGLQLSSFYFYPVHSRMMIEVFLAQDKEPVYAVGQIVWIKQVPYQERYKIGLEFLDVNSESQVNLKQAISDIIA